MLDDFATAIQRLIEMSTAHKDWIALGNISTFDPTTYRAKVIVNNSVVGPLPFLVPFHGLAPAHTVGASCVVLLVAGTPIVIAGVYYVGAQPIPTVDAVIDGDVTILGKLTADLMFQPPVFQQLPLATADWANQLVSLASSGTASTLHYCVDNGNATYTWKTLTLS